MELFEPKYYRNEKDGKITCLLCERACLLEKGATGFCGVNKNEGGELKNLAYGHPAAVNIDPIEKKPLNRFLQGSKTYSIGTLGCNFTCPWCQNYHISRRKYTDAPENGFIAPAEIAEGAIESGCMSVSYTYNEPTVFYPYARDIGMIARDNGLKNIFVSNAYQTAGIISDMITWVDAVNADLKCLDPETHLKYTGGRVDAVLRNLRSLAGSPVHLEITTLIIPGINDSSQELENIAEFIAGELGKDVPWHVSAFHPDYKMADTPPTAKEKIFSAVETGLKKGLKFVYPGNVWQL
jgi:pyruvate formate lyase activating enzyme